MDEVRQEAQPALAKATYYPDEVLVEFRSGVVILYEAAILCRQRDSHRAERSD